MHKRFLVLALGLAGFAGAAPAAFAAGDGETDGSGILVVASIKPVHSLVSAVMAGVAEPHLIIRGAQSPHTFSMRPSDAAALSKARVIFLIDEHKEVALAGPIGNLGDDALVVRLAGSQGLHLLPLREGGAFEEHDHGDDDDHREDDGHGHDHEHGDVDFHVWLDPENAVLMTYEIIEALSYADPDNAATYESNGYALIDRLDELIAEVDAALAPIRDKPFIVLHDAYRYFEQRFDLNAAGSISVNPERAPGAQRIAEIRDKVSELGGVCVFAEPQFDSRVIDVVTEGTAAEAGTVDPLGAEIEDGPELYFTLLRNLAASFKECMLGIG